MHIETKVTTLQLGENNALELRYANTYDSLDDIMDRA